MSERSRLLVTLQYLLDHTDEEHDVSTRQIKRMLEQEGFSAPDTRTIDSDIDHLLAAGYDIASTRVNGRATYYKIVSRDFDTVELKILIDAVAASRFITLDKSKVLISKLARMAKPLDREALESQLVHVRSIKRAVGGKMRAADALFRAILAKKQVQFQMVEYHAPDKSLVFRQDGKIYRVSPYAMIWADDRYYLVCWDEDRSMLITPRVDHIRRVKMMDEGIRPAPKDFDLGYYYSSLYKMYGGPEMDVTIECPNALMGKFIDRFGSDFEAEPAGEDAFRATVHACVGPTFFGWLFQYAGEMKLIGPEAAVSQYREQISKALGE